MDNNVVTNKKTRKRIRTPSKWKRNVRKEKRQHGDEYINTKGIVKPKKSVMPKSCHSNYCYFSCEKKILPAEREEINKQFWTLDDNSKAHFYSKHVQRVIAKRKRTENENSKKTYSYEYSFFLNNVKIRVCQEFFCSTLNISKNRIYYYFKKMRNIVTDIPRKSLLGQHIKKTIPEEIKNEVRQHIESFHCMESHYCRANTSKKYLDRGLNLTRMYNLYLETTENPVKFQMYSDIFNYEYNFAFFKPKKDLCDRCEAYKIIRNPSEEEKSIQKEHERKKLVGYQESERDRTRYKKGNATNACILTFDLQNVFSLPKANVGHYYYRSKLNCYNLTAHCNINNNVYNAIWHEFISGRGGTHIASALVKILKKVVEDNPHLETIILWSDSCVPQNRNCIMSCALQHFLMSPFSKNVKTIEHKYSEPGHGSIQAIDSAHSCIEKYVKDLEIWTPMNLIRILTHMPPHWKFKFTVLQMQENDYLDYQAVARTMSYRSIPYSKVKHIIYKKDQIFNISYRELFESEMTELTLQQYKKTCVIWPSVPQLKQTVGVSDEKKEAFKAMLPQIPLVERPLYELIISKDSRKKGSSVPSNTSSVRDKALEEEGAGNTSTTKKQIKKKTNISAGYNIIENSEVMSHRIKTRSQTMAKEEEGLSEQVQKHIKKKNK